jgi:hypothetical protein
MRDIMNYELIEIHLAEVAESLLELKSRLESRDSGLEEIGVLASCFSHVASHLCTAWHTRNMSNFRYEVVEQTHYMQLSSWVPNLSGDFRIVPLWWVIPPLDGLQSKKMNFGSCVHQVDKVHTRTEALRKLGKERIADNGLPLDLAAHFRTVFEHLCCTWHFRFLDNAEIGSLNESDLRLAASSFPSWGMGFTIVTADTSI